MKIIPAIDLKDGKCVRLYQGRADKETVYSEDPVEVAKRWEAEGAELLHLVDLDGAFEGGLKNFSLVSRIIKAIKIPVEIGGGIRSIESVRQYVEAGATYVILGTIAYSRPDLLKEACSNFPGKIIVGIDAKNGLVAVRGWEDVTKQTAMSLAKSVENEGVVAIIYTDIEKDGTLSGPNLKSTRELAESIDIPVIASGGVSGILDIKNLAELEQHGVTGVIVGKALYSGAISLSEAMKFTKNRGSDAR